MKNFTASKPVKTSGERVDEKKKVKDPNRGFNVDISGKLIIEEPKRGDKKNNESDSEDDDDDDNKKVITENSDSDDEASENARAKKLKRKANSSISQVSGVTGASSKYVAGGKGIHRPLNGTASVRSGYTNGTSKTDFSSKSTAHGSEYRSKKSKGDIKKKGSLDPYAYIPLSRNSLNKRKRAKNIGQFKNIVQAAQKGAAAGSKRRKV